MADGKEVAGDMMEMRKITGMLEPGTIKELYNRPILMNPDGTHSTTRSFSFGTPAGEVLIPQVVNGQLLTPEEAVAHYRKTGEHLGVFDTPQNADAYATYLHNEQEKYIQDQNLVKEKR